MAVENFIKRIGPDGKITGISTSSGKLVDIKNHPEVILALGFGVDDLDKNSSQYDLLAALLQGKARSKDN